MFKKLMICLMVPLLLFLNKSSGDSTTHVRRNVPQGFNAGPDIIAGNMSDLEQFGTVGTQRGLATAITSCNTGDETVGFFAMPNTDHPVVAHNLYRMSGGAGNDERFEQIGQSWVKHTYGAKQANSCNFGCQPGGDFTHLGVGCSDTYFNFQSAEQGDLGSRAWINPFTGVFSSNARNHTGHNHNAVSHMIVVEADDLNQTVNPGAAYYAELVYVTPDEYSWCQSHPGECNMYNNASYLQFSVAGTTNFSFTQVGSPMRMTPAFTAWPGASVQTIEPEPGIDGRAFIAYKVTGPVGGVYHYEYAIFNQNLDRGIQSFSVPRLLLPGISGGELPETNVGFHAPPQHPGFPNDGTQGDAGYSGAAWSFVPGAISLTWNSETFAQNQNANAIRWGTLYNFRFDSTTAPAAADATIGFFKTGLPITVAIQGPMPIGGPSPTPPFTPTPPPSPTPTATPCTVVVFEENFDDVIPPALPPGWGSGPGCWTTSSIDPDTSPNDAFVPDVDGISDCALNVTVSLPADPAVLSFRNNFNTEFSDGVCWDYGVLEVSSPNISGGDFLDITDSHVGGKIVAGGYTCETDGGPFAGRLVWAGNSNGYINTVVNLGPNLAGQTVTFRWRFVSDEAVSAPGWRIDTVKITGGPCPPTPTPTVTPTGTPSATPTPSVTPAGVTVQVGLGGTTFSPSDVSISVGETVHWVWASSNHSVTSGTPGNPDGIFDSGIQNVPFSFSHTFPTIGDFPYYCRVHGSMMTGTVHVLGASPTPTATPGGQAMNLSTRLLVQPGDNSGVGGFIITGNDSMYVLVRGIGPSLGSFGVPDPLADPTLALRDSNQTLVLSNDNWRSLQEAEIIATGLPPTNDLESAIVVTLAPGAYTAILSGNGTASGVGLVEIYNVGAGLGLGANLANLSTRGYVGTVDDVVIAGILIGSGASDTVGVRGIGPSLSNFGITNALMNPYLELRNNDGSLIIANNDWGDNFVQHELLLFFGLGLSHYGESGFVQTLLPGPYTAILSGVSGETGIGLVEVYDHLGALPTPPPTPTSAPNPEPNR